MTFFLVFTSGLAAWRFVKLKPPLRISRSAVVRDGMGGSEPPGTAPLYAPEMFLKSINIVTTFKNH